MINNEIFTNSENNCFKKFEEFANETHWFNSFDRLDWKSHADASGVTRDNRKVIVELKDRHYSYDEKTNRIFKNGKSYNSMFIESHKIGSLLLDTIDGFTPLYLNFMENGYVILFVLNQLKHRPTETKTMNIKSAGYDSIEVSKRQGLSMRDAIIMKKEKGKWKTIKYFPVG